MKFIETIIFFFIICCTTSIVFAQNITVDDTKSATDLVGILTNNSPCVSVSAETAKGDLFTAGKNSYGYFNNAGGNFPFSEGIILNTWSATNAVGPYVAGDGGGGSVTWSGDNDLNNALNLTKSINATSLEFDFTPLTNFISFNYIFASNEYQYYYPCEYSDAFAFLIKENIPGSSYKNLAIIPDTTTPVSSENVHPIINDFTDNGVLHKGCQPINEKYFKGFNTAVSPINYSGQTVVMNAQTSVIAGKNYHIKLVIADDKNEYFDSAVFLQAGSFSPKIDLGADQLLTTNNPVCYGKPYLIDTKLPATYTYQWFKDGSLTPILGESNPSYNVTAPGSYKVEVTISGTCNATGVIKIEYAPEINLNNTSLSKCDDTGNGTATFDLTKTATVIKNNNSSLTKVDFYETQTGTFLSNLIPNPSSFIKTSPTDQIVYALTTSIYGCKNNAELTLQTLPSSLIFGVSPDPIINAFSGNENAVELIPPTTGDLYEFSLDGVNYQFSPLFKGLSIGNYNAYIRKISTCEYLTYPIIIMDYPRFFTPNNDGYNDTWKIKNLEFFPEAIVTIFDRYGKLLTQVGATNSEWNGKYNGYELPADDYWFALNFGIGKIIKGHFSLKR